MNGPDIVSSVITGITYLTPLCVVIWKLAKADGRITDNTNDIKELQEKCRLQQVESKNIIIMEQRLESLEKSVSTEKSRSDRMESSLSDIKDNLRDVATKIDMLLKYNIQKKESL